MQLDLWAWLACSKKKHTKLKTKIKPKIEPKRLETPTDQADIFSTDRSSYDSKITLKHPF
jgi:hypothetical protein